MSVSINIIAEINDSASVSDLTIDREKIEKLTIESLANKVNQFSYQPDEFKCWCRAKSSAYIHVIDDKLLFCLLTSYWTDSDEFDVIFRPVQTSLPLTSNKLPELFTSKLSLRDVENKVDPLSQKEVENIDSEDRLVISNDAHSIMVDSNFIIDFIECQLNEGQSIFEIELKAVVETSTLSIKFTSDVWSRCLLRKHKLADKLLQKFTQVCERSISYQARVKQLHEKDAELFMKIKIFVNELNSFGSDPNIRARLESGDQFYMSDIYFTENERDFITKFPSPNGLSFLDHMNFKMQQKAKSGRTEICAAHDIAPIIIRIFDIQKGFKNEKTFISAKNRFIKSMKSSTN